VVEPGGVRADLDDTSVRARYAIAADGAASPIRRRLGIGQVGEPVAGTAVSALFRADLEPALRGRPVGALLARSAGAFLFARGDAADRSWQLGTHLRPDWDPAELPARVVEVIRRATGLLDLEPVVESVATWTTGARVADRLRAGPVFLAGDAAHEMPPYGGFGGNTGVQDAHNLAWKLAAVCRGEAPDALLDSYQAERRPLAELTVAQALLRSRKAPGAPPPPEQIDAAALVLGFRYGSKEVEDPARPSGDPGTRAAHVRLADGRPLLDRLDPAGFTLVCGAPPAVEPPGVRTVVVAGVDPRHRARWDAVYAGHAVLVRPDGIIAARLAAPDPAAVDRARRRALSGGEIPAAGVDRRGGRSTRW
jgi:hypothetical protein